MGLNQLKMLGEGPYPLPMDQFIERVNIYMDTDICIITSKSGIDFIEKDQHIHDSYEFTIPSSPMPYLILGKDHIGTDQNKILPINSGQSHGFYDQMLNKHLLSLHIDKEFLNETAYSIYGKSNVQFKQGDYIFGNELRTLIEYFKEECEITQPGRELVLKSLSTQITVLLLRQIDNNMPFLTSSNYKTAKKNIDQSIEYLHDQYATEYSLEEVAKLAHLTPYHFIKTFKDYTGKTPYEYLMQIKITKAKELLMSDSLNITEICFMCGFKSLSNFTTFFKRKIGVTPSEYKKIIHKKTTPST